ncbi:MAG: response regulator [Bernardetiaceae bacterium]|nr:response regulator [Bernardetiaceae bacterium]
MLVVDDDASIRLLLGKILSPKFQVVALTDAVGAFSWMSEGNMPDLVICDLNMPDFNGMEFLANMKKSGLYREVPVIMLSSFSQEEAAAKCLEQGAFAYFEKPFDPIAVRETVEKIFA